MMGNTGCVILNIRCDSTHATVRCIKPTTAQQCTAIHNDYQRKAIADDLYNGLTFNGLEWNGQTRRVIMPRLCTVETRPRCNTIDNHIQSRHTSSSARAHNTWAMHNKL